MLLKLYNKQALSEDLSYLIISYLANNPKPFKCKLILSRSLDSKGVMGIYGLLKELNAKRDQDKQTLQLEAVVLKRINLRLLCAIQLVIQIYLPLKAEILLLLWQY